jgi:hypothetical protein
VANFIDQLQTILELELDDENADLSVEALSGSLIEANTQFCEGTLSYAEYRDACETAFNHAQTTIPATLTHAPQSILEHFINILRAAFNLVDRAVSALFGLEPMEKSTTLLAKTLTGRNHFFNRPEINIQEKIQAFAEKLAQFPRS